MRQKGFIALTSVLILGVVLLAVVIAAATSGIYARFDALEREYKAESEALARGCIGLIQLRLGTDEEYGGNENITVEQEACSVGEIRKVDADKTFTVSVEYRHARTVRSVSISDNLSIIQNREIPSSQE